MAVCRNTPPWLATDLDGLEPTWTLPKGTTKQRRAHVVPLAPQAAAVLVELRALALPGTRIFSLAKDGTRIGRNTLAEAFKAAKLPIKAVPHGWRTSFSTIMNERFPADRKAIDLMLSHAKGTSAAEVSGSEGAYNRAQHLARRRELAVAWAGLIQAGVPSASVHAAHALPANSALRAV
jgi:integrase